MASPARLRELTKLRCAIFNKPYNPDNLRIGTEILQAPLRGPELINYYYPSLKAIPTAAQMNKIDPEMNCYDPDEKYRLERIERLKRKGKGAPKKQSAPKSKK